MTKAASRKIAPVQLLEDKLSRANTFEDMAKSVVQTGAQVASSPICTFWRVYTEEGKRRLRLAAAFGVKEPYTLAQEVTYDINRRDGVTGYVASEMKSVLVRSFEELRRKYAFCHRGKMDVIQWKGQPERRLRNLYAVPVSLGGEVQGVLKVENRKGGGFTKHDIAKVDALRRPLAVFAKTMRMLDAHEQRLIEVPAKLADALVRPFETAQLMQEIVDITAETLDAKVCSLWLVDEGGRNLIHRASRGFAGPLEGVPPYRISPAPKEDKDIKGITAWVGIRRKPFWANSHAELRKHPSWRGTWDPAMYGGKEAAARRFHSMCAVPLLLNNELLGVLKVENPRRAAHFTLADRRKCELMANYVVILLALTKQLRLQLLPSMAHTLKSPAAGIAMMLDQLSRELAKPSPDLDRLRRYAEEIKKPVFAHLTMSQTIMAEVSARVGSQQTEPTDLLQFLKAQLVQLNQLAPQGIEVVIAEGSQPYSVPLNRLERTWLEIVIFNLAHNAIRYSPPAGGRVELECRCNGDDRRAFLAVTDQGPGVPPENQDHIFELYYHTVVKGWPAGTGMGLFEVKRLLNQLGWSICQRNVSPHGARFEIQIPEDWRAEHGKGAAGGR
jgi:signal transduction histidine kinase